MRCSWLLAAAAAFQEALGPLGGPGRPAPRPVGNGAVTAAEPPVLFVRGSRVQGFPVAPDVGGAAAFACGAAAALALSRALASPVSRRGADRPRAKGLRMDAATQDSEKTGLSDLSDTDRPEGSHGTGFRFMPLSTMPKDSAPALVCLAGMFPGLTADDLLRPYPLPVAPNGRWNYHVLNAEASASGFVALPGHWLLDTNPNTVGVVCTGKVLGLEFPDGKDHEVIALINRSDPATETRGAFDPNKFYAFADESGAVHIRWMDAVPEGWRVLGRLLYTQMPMIRKPGASDEGFAELSDDFEF